MRAYIDGDFLVIVNSKICKYKAGCIRISYDLDQTIVYFIHNATCEIVGSDLITEVYNSASGTTTYNSAADIEDTLEDFFVDASSNGGLPHANTAIPYWGSIDDLDKGWQICDGTNGTPDLRNQFIRGASGDSSTGSDDEIGTTVDATTALPSGTDFSVSSESHTHTVNPPETTVESSGAHTHSASNATTYPTGSSSYKVPYSTGTWGVEYGGSLSGTTTSYPSMSGQYTTPGSNLGHTHTITVTSAGAHTHTVDIASFTSGSDEHTHTISGGDDETAPQHILMYWITYTGSSAPNWGA